MQRIQWWTWRVKNPIDGKSLDPWIAMRNRAPTLDRINPTARYKPLLLKSLRYDQLKQTNKQTKKQLALLTVQHSNKYEAHSISQWDHTVSYMQNGIIALLILYSQIGWDNSEGRVTVKSRFWSWIPCVQSLAFPFSSYYDFFVPWCHTNSSFPLTLLSLDQKRATLHLSRILLQCIARVLEKF